MKIGLFVKSCGAALAGILSFMFGGFDVMLKTLLFCIVFDYITGILAAIYQKKLNSHVGFRGIIKKIGILCIVALSHVVGTLMGIEAVRAMVIGFYISNEAISILENGARMEIPVLSKLKEFLEQLSDNVNK